MIKMFCDLCGDEVKRNFVSARLIRSKGRATVEIMVGIDGTTNKGHICYDCLHDVVAKGKDKK